MEAFTRSLYKEIYCGELGISRWNPHTKRKRLEKNSTVSTIFITQGEGKIFFGVIAKRMTRFVINNGYVNTSIQKTEVPGFPGCIEHTTMLWDRIKTAENNKTELHVLWLENAYGLVRQQLLEKAMEFFWIPEDIKKL